MKNAWSMANKAVQTITEDDMSSGPKLRKLHAGQRALKPRKKLQLRSRTRTRKWSSGTILRTRRKLNLHLWLLCQATSQITSGNFLSSYASGGRRQWCFWVLCWCSLQRNQTLMGTWAGSRGYFIFDSILYLLRTKMHFWLGHDALMMPSCIFFPINLLKKVN